MPKKTHLRSNYLPATTRKTTKEAENIAATSCEVLLIQKPL